MIFFGLDNYSKCYSADKRPGVGALAPNPASDSPIARLQVKYKVEVARRTWIFASSDFELFQFNSGTKAV